MKPALQDRRLVPARPDLAAAHLRGVVEADRFIDGERCRVLAALADVRAEPRSDCSIDTQALAGETVIVYDRAEGYAWVQLDRDGYVGWIPEAAIGPPGPEPTHLVTALRTLVFPGPDLRLPMIAHLPQGARVTVRDVVERRGLHYALLADGTATVMRHLSPIDAPSASDFVAVAEAYVGTPYLWGGRSSLGIDCSGLVQTALMMAGISAPRDTDMQEAVTGEEVRDPDLDDLRRGDLVFWTGHVALVAAPDRLLHATGHFMATVEEPLAPAIGRIAAAGFAVTSVRRLAAPNR
jgi:cell wall-associated NlpC family hydrolase